MRSHGQFANRLFWSRRDGIHLIVCGWHFHFFIWTRGAKRSPFYFRAMRCVAGSHD